MKRTKNILVIIIACISTFQLHAQSFKNPILAGFYPDPSICKAGDDYYIVNSSFAYYPGLPIFHSKDLANWQQMGYVLNRPEQLNLDGAGVSRGLFAPSISYHNGLFYVVCTLIDKGGNFVVAAKNPEGPWSNPVWLSEVDGIDPSLFFDDNSKAYIVYNSIPPNNKSMHDGHRTIRINEFDARQMKIVSSNKIIVNGGTDMAKKPVWIEAPHIFKKDGWYYLICAEGGTAYNHSEVVFRTKHLDSAFVPFDKNPILTQRQLDRNRKNPVTTTGHAEFVEDKNGKWWAVFLACRPYEADYFNTGRETFMAPVEWKDGWPIINPNYQEIQYSYPINATIKPSKEKFNGNFFFKDEFNKSKLNNRYSFLRTVRENWYSINKGKLQLKLRPETCSGNMNPSFVGFRQPHLKGYAATSMNFMARDSNEKAGLVVFQNEQHYYFICQSIQDGKPLVQLYKSAGNGLNKETILLASLPIYPKNGGSVFFKIETKNSTYSFYFATQKNQWQLLKDGVDGKFLSTQVAGGFVGCFYAMYATSNGAASNNIVTFKKFECNTNDHIYQ